MKHIIHTQNVIKIMYPYSRSMKSSFDERTKKHVGLVQQVAKQLADKYPDMAFLLKEVADHDHTKWLPNIVYGYVWMNAVYNLGMSYPSVKVSKLADYAWDYHKWHENHHPEFWEKHFGSVQAMPIEAMAHMLCDWEAMSREFGGNTREWYSNQHNKWDFSDKQRQDIDILLTRIETL